MLGNAHYYHQLTRKAVVLFGRLFDDISIIRKNDQTSKEVSRFLVPIIYSPKEKMVTRIFSDPDLTRQLKHNRLLFQIETNRARGCAVHLFRAEFVNVLGGFQQ